MYTITSNHYKAQYGKSIPVAHSRESCNRAKARTLLFKLKRGKHSTTKRQVRTPTSMGGSVGMAILHSKGSFLSSPNTGMASRSQFLILLKVQLDTLRSNSPLATDTSPLLLQQRQPSPPGRVQPTWVGAMWSM